MLNNEKFTSNRIPLLDCCVSFSNLFYFLLIRCGEYKKRGTTDILLLFFILFQDHHHLYKFYSRWSIQSDSDLSQQHSSTCVFCRYFYVGSLHFFRIFLYSLMNIEELEETREKLVWVSLFILQCLLWIMYGKTKEIPRKKHKKNEWNTEQEEEEGNTNRCYCSYCWYCHRKCKILCEVTTYLNNTKKMSKKDGKTL